MRCKCLFYCLVHSAKRYDLDTGYLACNTIFTDDHEEETLEDIRLETKISTQLLSWLGPLSYYPILNPLLINIE